jgi:hypothetical protein
MTASDSSFIGIAKQTAKGTPNTTDASFKYLLFSRGGIAPSSNVVPLDPEVGGGAMLRDVQKMGVMSGGQLEFTPRPDTLGLLLLGALGNVTSVKRVGGTAPYDHTFALGTDQFAAPYFTVRSAPGNMWGEQMQDMRVASLALSWEGANYVRAAAGFVGGLPSPLSTALWSAAGKVDGGPQFITPISAIELPTGTPAKVLSGGFSAGMSIPMDQQWVVGSYSPDDFDITQRSFALSLVLKVTDGILYNKMMYDPSGGSAWAASMMKEASFKINLKSPTMIETTIPYELTINGNGGSGSAGNVVWSASPIGIRAGQQVVMAVTGIFLADATKPIEIKLTNKVISY